MNKNIKKWIVLAIAICIFFNIMLVSSAVQIVKSDTSKNQDNIKDYKGWENRNCILIIIGKGMVDADRFHLPGGTNVPLVYDEIVWGYNSGFCISIGSWGYFFANGVMSGATDMFIGLIIPKMDGSGYFIFGVTHYCFCNFIPPVTNTN